MKLKAIISTMLLSCSVQISAQETNQDDLGAWYMYFFNGNINNSWGVQGDIQYRNFNLGGDLEQLLLRTGIYYKPKNTDILLTLGIANITTGTIGESEISFNENRIYQEALLPQKVGIFHFNHRFRYEQRFIENQNFRTRFRYNILLNIPLNKKKIEAQTIYLALYNELFINGERNIGSNRTVPLFDRNRIYSGLGYQINPKVRIQIGYMNQSLETSGKNQLQFSLHHNF